MKSILNKAIVLLTALFAFIVKWARHLPVAVLLYKVAKYVLAIIRKWLGR